MKQIELGPISADHAVWLATQGKEGKQAVFEDIDLSNLFFMGDWQQSVFRNCNMSRCIMEHIVLNHAVFDAVRAEKLSAVGASFRSASFFGCDFEGCNFEVAAMQSVRAGHSRFYDCNFRSVDADNAMLNGCQMQMSAFQGSILNNVSLVNAYLAQCNFGYCQMGNADLHMADLSRATLLNAILEGADLSEAKLSSANLLNTDLSGCKGIMSATQWLQDNLVRTDEGYVAYKQIGHNATSYDPPAYWDISPGSFLEEVPDYNRTVDCGCGVNVATRQWCRKSFFKGQLWQVTILFDDLADVVVPYGTDGKFRARRVRLDHVVEDINERDTV